MEEEKESPSSVRKAAIKIYEEKIGKIIDVKKYEVQEMSKPPQKKKKKEVSFDKGQFEWNAQVEWTFRKGNENEGLGKELLK